jgi:hypothetical protein
MNYLLKIESFSAPIKEALKLQQFHIGAKLHAEIIFEQL